MIINNEEFYPIKGFDNYTVAQSGKIWSKARHVIYTNRTCFHKGKFLKGSPNGDGYLNVSLFQNSKRQDKMIHQVVMETFVPNPNNLPEINHKDGNKENNDIKNLEWCTKEQNRTHAMEILGAKLVLTGEDSNSAKLSWESVQKIRIFYATGNYTLKELADEYNVSESTISLVVNNLTWIV